MQEDLKEIAGLDLTVEEGNAPASSNDIYIESQTDDTYGVGDEGYLLKTDDEGVHILCTYLYRMSVRNDHGGADPGSGRGQQNSSKRYYERLSGL